MSEEGGGGKGRRPRRLLMLTQRGARARRPELLPDCV